MSAQPTSAPAPAPGLVQDPRRRRAAFRAVLRTEAVLFRREPAALFWVMVFPTLLMVILGLIPAFREVDDSLGGRRVIDLYVPIAVLLGMITAGVQVMPGVLTTYRERGILRRLSATPARPSMLITAQVVLHAVAIAVAALLALAVGRLAFDVALPRQLAGYGLAALLAALAALAVGAVIAAISRTIKAAQAVGTVIFFPMMFTAGVWAPVETMPDALRNIVELTPLGASSGALNEAATGAFPDLVHLGVTALWVVVLLAAAARWFRWE
ncbi:ABC-2 type transporter [Streptomyces sp. YIM 130001]|uniref:ABC transporter permease n=1 Tax=Streptomyces sp. YIM 130001 TaxID=2259644 RepID=UPI000E6560F4|nr:ABC transporter permease [Streptomyces sp. YIM 130001]RII15676.1 ABC-2 type transporter [Streptomyces sp. YIM 130001]